MAVRLVHEQTYKDRNIAAVVHRLRLKKILRLLDSLIIADEGQLADFGCSNGYIISVLQQGPFRGKCWKFFGFDHSEQLLALAKEKGLPEAEFDLFDLNSINTSWQDRFNLVLCFETLEHTGNYRNALLNLYHACKAGGNILISIPNEKGLPGLLKYAGRKALRKHPYGNFFEGKSEIGYVWHLLSNKTIEVFRTPEAEGWGPHLGFDWKLFEGFIQESLIDTKRCRLLLKSSSSSGFNLFYLLEKLQ